jgi:alcohol dehydrogenase class IV
VPTTAGTGSEVGRSAVISDDVTHVKRIIYSPHLLARAVFADPELTVGLPAAVTAATGMDALTHNVEAYLARAFHPICDGIALEGIRLARRHLATAVAQPRDLGARGGMLMCSMMGAIAFQKGLGVVHSTAHALGTYADLHHGLANAVMIDHALTHNVEAVPGRFTAMAVAAGLDDASPEGFLRWLADLKAEIGVPRALSDLGIPAEATTRLAGLAFEDGCHLNNPIPVSVADLTAIFTRASS